MPTSQKKNFTYIAKLKNRDGILEIFQVWERVTDKKYWKAPH